MRDERNPGRRFDGLKVPPRGVVDLWLDDLRGHEPLPVGCEDALSEDEAERAVGFRDPAARSRFVRGRLLVRRALGGYLGVRPAALSFRYGHRGRPTLSLEGGVVPPLGFNLSHSGGVVALAVAPQSAVGVDVEARRPVKRLQQLADRYFASAEADLLRGLPDGAETEEAFLDCWTRKEAYLKALGEGIAHGLARVEVSFGPGSGDARILALDGDAGLAQQWSLLTFSAGDQEAVGCVAVREPGARLRLRDPRSLPEL